MGWPRGGLTSERLGPCSLARVAPRGDLPEPAARVHEAGYRVALTGEGADEALAGARTAQQWTYELFGGTRDRLYTEAMWTALEGHSPFDDLNLSTSRMTRWHPINQASYVDYHVFLPGLLLLAKGDRSAMHSSVETRPPFLDEDVVAFCARLHPPYKRCRRRRSLARVRVDIGLMAVLVTQLWHHVFCGGGLADLPAWAAPPPE